MMKKKMSKKCLSVLLAFCMLVSLITAAPVMTWAKQTPDIPKSATFVAYPEHGYQPLARIPSKASSLKTSNKSVVSVVKQSKISDKDIGTHYYIYLKAQKPGTATVSVKFKGKTYKTRVTVKKYVNPIQSVKIGSTSVSGSKFNSSSIVNLSYAKFANKKVKTTVTLKKGWKLDTDFYLKTPVVEYFQKNDLEGKPVKNGSKIPVKGGKGFEILVTAINEKTGLIEYISLVLK